MPSNKKKAVETPQNQVKARILRTESYAESVRRAFANTVNAILSLNKTLPKLDEGVMYSFDGDNARKQKQVEALLRQLHSVCTMAIERGIRLEWQKASAEADKLCKTAFGKAVLSTPEFKAWTARNKEAMNAFINRSDNGLNLSDRVWKSVRQLRDEMEVAMTVSIGEGESASQMSRKVRQYLNDPDLMFRRFRYKDENGNWKKKWKKRVKDEETGKIKFIDYDRDSYIPTGAGQSSRGVYKSAAKNAMRVARTETNIAYRRADHQRWSDMDFVLGVRVQLSHSHPKKDICDKLQGDYPKSFVFDGWHPQCFCYATPITIPPEETKKLNDIMLSGGDWRSELRKMARGRQITEYPKDFKDFITDNKDKIKIARERGTEPYFIKNNASVIDEILDPKPISETIKKARIRQGQRTPEEIDDIKNRWAQHEHRLSILKKADERHQARTPEQIQAIQEAAKKWQEEKAHMRKTADNVLKAAKDYNEVDYSALQELIGKNQIQKMYSEAKKVQKELQEVIKQEKSLSALIPNVHEWHKQFTLQELQDVYDAVEKKLDFIEHKPLSYKYKNELEQKYHLLDNEIKYVEDPNMFKAHTIYPTYKVSQAAYSKKMAEVKYEIDVNAESDKLKAIKSWLTTHPKAAKIQSLVAEAEKAIAEKKDLSFIQNKVAVADNDYKHRLAAEKSRAKKKGTAKEIKLDKTLLDDDQVLKVAEEMNKAPKAAWNEENMKALKDAIKAKDSDAVKKAIEAIGVDLQDSFNEYRQNAAIWNRSAAKADDYFHENAVDFWAKLTDDEKTALWGYTGGSAYITEPLRAIKGYYYYYKTKKAQIQKDIDAMTTALYKEKFKDDTWVKRDSASWNVDYIFGIKLSDFIGNESALVGKVGLEDSFQSCGSCRSTYFTATGMKDVVLNIYCPKGTYGAYAQPWSSCGTYDGGWDGKKKANPTNSAENEVILQRGAKMKITKAEYTGSKWYIDVEVLGFDVRDFELKEATDGIYCEFK